MGCAVADMELVPKYITGNETGSFAEKTAKIRLPAILQSIIETVWRQRHVSLVVYGKDGVAELSDIISKLTFLRNNILESKPVVATAELLSDGPSWLQLIKGAELHDTPTWLSGAFLHVECLMYRFIADVFLQSRFFQTLDVFSFQKEQAFVGFTSQMKTLGDYLLLMLIDLQNSAATHETLVTALESLFLTSLWGNKCDLSLTAGLHVIDHNHELEYLKYLLALMGSKKRVDFILDNSGLELFSDLCLADLLLELNIVSAVHFHVKAVPWYVSDTTARDFNWTIELLRASERASLSQLGQKWQNRLHLGQFVIQTHNFWTTGHSYADMKTVASELYEDLSRSALLIFKGDLNYRKLVDDRMWPTTTAFETSLRGFSPAPLCALRTVKAEVITGLVPGQAEQLNKSSPNWMISSDFAVIQFRMGTKTL